MKTKFHYLFMIHALAALALLALPASVQAQFILTTNNGAITITAYTATNRVVVIPSSTNGFPVTSIGPNAFETSGLTSVTIPDSVTNIAPFAFDECTNLTGVAIGTNVTGIGLYAFGLCSSLTAITVNTNNPAYSSVDGVLFNHSQTSLIQYPGGKIGAYTIPFSVSNVGTQAFTGNYSLISVTIPGSVNNVQQFAFASCTNLTNACFEGNAPIFGSQVFQSDPLTAILYVSGGSGWGTNYGSIPIEPCAQCSQTPPEPYDGFYWAQIGSVITITGYAGPGGAVVIPINIANLPVTSIAVNAFSGNTNLTSVTIPGSVINIEMTAFANCYYLTNVVLGTNVTSMGEGAFEECPKLASITIPNSLTNIGALAFDQCYGLGSVILGTNVASIGTGAFDGCTSLTSVTIPDSVTSIGNEAFYDCASLSTITVGALNSSFRVLSGVLFDKNQTTLIQYPPAYVRTSYTIPDTVTSIGDGAFIVCTNLTSITIPNSVSNIGVNAFVDCTNLASVTIPNGVTSIGDYAFEACTSLASVTIANSVTSIGSSAFEACTKLTNACFEGNAPSFGFAGDVFFADPLTAILYVSGATGWGTNFQGIPTQVCAECGNVGVGALQVTINPPGAVQDGAQWQVDGGAWQTSEAVVSNLPASNHTVSFTNIVGWFTPAAQTVTINSGVTTNISATYVQNIGALQVTINPPCAVGNGAEWKVDGGAWQNSGAIVTNLAGGNHTVSFTNIVGWITPGSQSVPVTANITNTTAGNYIEGSTPGMITWINIGGPDQNWSTPANWDLNRAPTTNDIVLIPNTGGSFCLLDVDATVAGLVIGDCAGGGSDGLGINGHTLTVAGMLTIKSNAVFRVDSGILMGTSNTVISGVLGWTSGGLAGTLTLASNSILNISGNPGGQYFSGCTLTNYGTVNWSGDALNAGGSVVIDNYGLWNAQDDRYFNGPNVVFNNYGTFRKSGGVGGYPGTYFNSGVVFNQLAGVLDIQSGTNGLWLTLTSGGSFSGGYVTTNLNGITDLGGGNFNINGTLTCTNVLFGGGYLVGTNVINGGLNWQNGQWNNTVVTLSSNSVLTLNNPAWGKGINGSILTNYGTVNWSAAAVNGDGGTVIDNYGVWNAQDDQYFNGGNYGAVFNNYGTFRKSGGVGGYPGTYFNSGAVFNQLAGVLDIQSGTNGLWLTLTSGGSFTGGYVTTNLNGITDLGGDNFNINGTLTCTNVLFGGGYLVGTNVINGGLNWQNGQWNNTVVTLSSNSVLTLNNSAFSKGINGSILTNYGTVNWSAAAVNGDGGTVIDNYGVWNAQDDHYFNGGSYGAVFNNFGTFRKSGGVGGYPGTYFNSGAVFNQLAGVLDIQSGTNGLWLTLTSGGSFTGGYVTTNLNGITDLGGGNFNINGTLTCTNVLFGGGYLVGTNVINGGLNWQNGQWNNTVVTLSSNSVLTINNSAWGKGISGSIFANYGTVNWSAGSVNGDGGTVIDNYGVWNAQDNQYFNGGAGVVFNNFGTFRKSGGASGYPGTYFTAGTIFNQAGGTLSVQTGEVTLGGTYSLTNGTLNFGINSPTDNGFLQLGGVTLGGSLSVNLNVNFAPVVGDQIGIVGSSGLSGTFNSVNLPAGFSVGYSASGVLLTVSGPVPVEILSPQRVGTNFLFQFATASGQNYTIQRNDDLTTTNWVFYTNIVGTGSAMQVQVPVTVTPAKSFFRVREP